MENPVVKEIACRLQKTPAQVLLRQLISRGISAIPKSTNPDRLRQNIDLFDFELSDDDMKALGELDQNVRVCDFGFFPGYVKLVISTQCRLGMSAFYEHE
jgi:alcohol dehydrogenase (NADP+)